MVNGYLHNKMGAEIIGGRWSKPSNIFLAYRLRYAAKYSYWLAVFVNAMRHVNVVKCGHVAMHYTVSLLPHLTRSRDTRCVFFFCTYVYIPSGMLWPAPHEALPLLQSNFFVSCIHVSVLHHSASWLTEECCVWAMQKISFALSVSAWSGHAGGLEHQSVRSSLRSGDQPAETVREYI